MPAAQEEQRGEIRNHGQLTPPLEETPKRARVSVGVDSLAGAASNPWLGLLLAALVAFVTLGIVLYLIRRNIRLALAAPQGDIA